MRMILGVLLVTAWTISGSGYADESKTASHLTPEEKAFVKKAKEDFKNAKKFPAPSEALQKRMQAEGEVPAAQVTPSPSRSPAH